MKSRSLLALCLFVLIVPETLAQPTAPAPAPFGFLVDSGSDERIYSTQYSPQPGDIVLYDDFNKFFHFVYKFANATPPTHCAIVIADRDGKPALLELTGPRVLTARVQVMDPKSRMEEYPGVIMVRKIRRPLTPAQSQALAEFAHAEVGKSFAVGRVILAGTPFSPRNGLRNDWFGRTPTTRHRWFCSELVVTACTQAGIIDERVCKANATYPSDLAFDERVDLSPFYHPPIFWCPTQPR